MWRLDGGIERSTHGDCERGSGVDRIKNPVVPDFRRCVVCARSLPIFFQNRLSGGFVILRRKAPIIDRQLLCLDICQHSRRLIGTHAISQPIDIQEAKTPAPSETNHSGAEGKAPGPKSEKSKKPEGKPRIARRERPKRARSQVVARSAFATNEAETVQPSYSGDTFFNEVAILDEEIKELRRLLAQKLYLQNAQLKNMLERFNVS